jgi:hypothetical protein
MNDLNFFKPSFISRVVFFYSNIQSKTGLDELSRIGFSSFKKFGKTVGVFAFSQVKGIGWNHSA